MVQQIDFSAVAAAALARIDTLLDLWLPDGVRKGREYVARNPTRADNKAGSFSVNVDTGAWADFATGDKGGDLLSLYHYLFACGSMLDAARELMGRFGCGEPQAASVQKPAPKKAVEWETVMPVPDFALNTMLQKHSYRSNGAPEMVSVYKDAQGLVLGAVCRFRKSDGAKDDLPRTFCRNVQSGVQEWRWKSWDLPRPLYGLDVLAAKSAAPVLLVEGEKCKNAAEKSGLFDDFAVVSWSGGTNGYAKSDWSPINHREVVLWADADAQRERLTAAEKAAGVPAESKTLLPDDDQPGIKTMRAIAAILTGQGCLCRMVTLPESGVLPAGYDVADALVDGKLDPVAAVRDAVPFVADIPPVPTTVNDVDLLDVNAALSTAAADDAAAANEGDGAAVLRDAGWVKELHRYFLLIDGKVRAIDVRTGKEFNKGALMARFSASSVKTWLESADKRIAAAERVRELQRFARALDAETNPRLRAGLERYTYLDGSSSYWDGRFARMVDRKTVEADLGECMAAWVNNPDRKVIPLDNLVFDPSCILKEEDGYINTFRGFPFVRENRHPFKSKHFADFDDAAGYYQDCKHIIELLGHLCNGNQEDMRWVLNWIAYPLQTPGAKMNTAVLMKSETQGSGKSLFWGGCVMPLFGDYGTVLGQAELESKFNSSFSQKLFILFEEVLSSSEKYDQMGKLKHFITTDTIWIEGKNVNSYAERNQFNLVFLSNHIQPIPLEKYDRRFMVIEPKSRLPEELARAVAGEIENGGLEAFYSFLCGLPLRCADGTDFDRHTHPILNDAKLSVIKYGEWAWSVFLDDWKEGEGGLEDVPFVCCTVEDLYSVYKVYINRVGERSSLPRRKFSENVRQRYFRQKRRFNAGGREESADLFKVKDVPFEYAGREKQFYSDQVAEFRRGMHRYINDITAPAP